MKLFGYLFPAFALLLGYYTSACFFTGNPRFMKYELFFVFLILTILSFYYRVKTVLKL